jgi:hypothetical protein
MKGTIYANRLPRSMQMKKGWEPLMYSVKRERIGFLTPAFDIQCHLNSFCPTVPTHGGPAGLGSLILQACHAVLKAQLHWMFLINGIDYTWFQTFAVFWMLYAFFWVIPRHLNFICQRFRTLFHLHRQVAVCRMKLGLRMLGCYTGKVRLENSLSH